MDQVLSQFVLIRRTASINFLTVQVTARWHVVRLIRLVLVMWIYFATIRTFLVRLLRAPFVSLLVPILIYNDFTRLITVDQALVELLLLEVENLLRLLGRQVGLPQIDHLLEVLRC